MCALCEEAAVAGRGVSIAERPRQLLGGMRWSGAHGDLAARGIRAARGAAHDLSAFRDTMWKSPIVGLTRSRGDGGLDYFAGIAIEDDEALPDGFERLDMPSMTVITSWHGPQDGDVLTHYGQMIDWLRGSGYRRASGGFDHREEYPHDIDLDAAPTLRLLLPVERETR